MSSAERHNIKTVEEYLAFEEAAVTRSEYVDGWVRAMSGATVRHNRIKMNCAIVLGTTLKGKRCQPFDSDMKVRIPGREGTRFYYPDLQVVCDSNAPTAVFQDSPVLIIEVLSPATRRYDLDEKLNAYLSIPSLQHYLVLEQHQPIATLFSRAAGGFLRHVFEGIAPSIELPCIECTLPMIEIYHGVEFSSTCVQEPDPEYELS